MHLLHIARQQVAYFVDSGNVGNVFYHLSVLRCAMLAFCFCVS